MLVILEMLPWIIDHLNVIRTNHKVNTLYEIVWNVLGSMRQYISLCEG